MIPFAYPRERHVRRHGPGGYKEYQRFRPWLRDEFAFRCVYCLKREQWGVVRGSYGLDHFLPQALRPDLALEYDNLLYACAACNTAKGDATVPNPCDCLLAGEVVVREDGTIEAGSDAAARLIRVLGLDDPEYREFRMLWIGIVQLARHHDLELFRTLMKFPEDLPDLESLRPPRNSRPEGVNQSSKARRDRNDLPNTY